MKSRPNGYAKIPENTAIPITPPHLGAGALRDDQRYDTGNKREGRHENGRSLCEHLEAAVKSIASLALQVRARTRR